MTAARNYSLRLRNEGRKRRVIGAAPRTHDARSKRADTEYSACTGPTARSGGAADARPAGNALSRPGRSAGPRTGRIAGPRSSAAALPGSAATDVAIWRPVQGLKSATPTASKCLVL